jgi:hypothetical protein
VAGRAVVVWLRATGDAPILKQQKVKVRPALGVPQSGAWARAGARALSGWRCRQVLASEKFAKIVDVLRQKTKSDQLVRAVWLLRAAGPPQVAAQAR